MADTLSSAVTFQQEIKKSVFLAWATPMPPQGPPQAVLRPYFQEGATHNCWAYRFGQQFGYHDASEPSGTAGRPILATIDAMHFDQIGVVIARWFGGIKLGSAGLMRAYRQTAALCLKRALRKPIIAKRTFLVACQHHQIGLVYALLKTFAVRADQPQYEADGVYLRIEVIADQYERFRQRLIDVTANHVTLTEETNYAGS